MQVMTITVPCLACLDRPPLGKGHRCAACGRKFSGWRPPRRSDAARNRHWPGGALVFLASMPVVLLAFGCWLQTAGVWGSSRAEQAPAPESTAIVLAVPSPTTPESATANAAPLPAASEVAELPLPADLPASPEAIPAPAVVRP